MMGGFILSFYSIALVVGILCGLVFLLILFSLLSMAQRGDRYLEKLAGMSGKNRRFKKGQTGTGD
jgi:hypothetical protein